MNQLYYNLKKNRIKLFSFAAENLLRGKKRMKEKKRKISSATKNSLNIFIGKEPQGYEQEYESVNEQELI